jgi:hypothetical protein
MDCRHFWQTRRRDTSAEPPMVVWRCAECKQYSGYLVNSDRWSDDMQYAANTVKELREILLVARVVEG